MRFAATPPIDGTLAKYYKLPEDFCYKLADHVSLEEGALAEPLSVAVHIVRQAELKPGSNVVIFGAGPVGLLCCAVARVFGAEKIVCVDMSSDRLTFAKGYAATHTYLARKESAEDAGRAILEESGIEGGADVAIDATGAEPCIQTCIEVLRAGGVYVQAGEYRASTSQCSSLT
jgi:D-xylulose reductase